MPILTTLAIAGAGTFAGTQIIEHRKQLLASSQSLISRLRQLLQDEEGEKPEDVSVIDPEEAETNLYLGLSTATMGVAVVGALTPLSLGPLTATGIIVSSAPIFIDAYEGLSEKRIRSTIVDCAATVVLVAGHYYLVSAFTCIMYFVGQKLMLLSQDRTRRDLINIFGEQPRTVWLLREREEVEIRFEQLQTGDVVIVAAGQVIPVDGIIVDGVASVDQHMLTGESQPVEKEVGATVFAATVVLSGRIYIEVQQTGEATVVAQIGEILEQTVDYRTTVELRSQQIADRGVLPLLGLSGLAFATNGSIGTQAILNSYFNDGLRMSSPLTLLNFLNIASKHGLLVKDGRVLELLGTVDTVIFDKTGTLTQEEPHIGRIHTFNDWSETDLLRHSAAVEAKQTHPIARAIIKAAKERNLGLPSIDESAYKVGYGIEAKIGGRRIQIGSARFMRMIGVSISAEVTALQDAPHAPGVSLVYVSVEGVLAGVLEMHPTIRPEAQSVINALHAHGLELVIISGDHVQPTQALANQMGIDRFFAEVLPQDKASLVQQLQEEGRHVCFVGDGINDTIALKQATVSVSLNGATSAATDTAQVVLMNGTLEQLPYLFEVGDRFNSNMRGNIIATVVPSLASIGGVFLLHTGIGVAVSLYSVSIASSLVNATIPALRNIQITHDDSLH